MTVSFMLCVFYNKKVIGTLCSLPQRRYGNLFGGVQHQCTGLKYVAHSPSLPLYTRIFFPNKSEIAEPQTFHCDKCLRFSLCRDGRVPYLSTHCSVQRSTVFNFLQKILLLLLLPLFHFFNWYLCVYRCVLRRDPGSWQYGDFFCRQLGQPQREVEKKGVGNRIAVMRCCFFRSFQGGGLVLFIMETFNQELHFHLLFTWPTILA